MNDMIQKAVELKTFCDSMKVSGAICEECADVLKETVEMALVNNPEILQNEEDIDFTINVKLHVSCITRILIFFKKTFDSDRFISRFRV